MYTGPHIITDGLILIMNADSARSYPGTGTTWLDLSGNDINGTLSSSTMATVVPGEMRLNNSTDKINYGHNTLLEPVSITVSAWVNLDNRNNRHILITKWYGYSFEVASNGQPYFRLNGPGDQYSSEALTWGEWYLITGTFDNSSSIVYNQGSFNIPYTGNPVHAKGEISTLSIYNRALTSDEVMQNYNAQKSRFGL